MIFESTDPLSSRARFKSKGLLNVIVIAILFALGVSALSIFSSFVFQGQTAPMLLGDLLALGGAYYLYVLWGNEPIRLRCRHCHRIVLSNTPWVCGFCKGINRNANKNPFVDKCGHCGDEQKSYKCHHCGGLIFLSEDQDMVNFACCLNSREPETDERAKKLQKFEHDAEERQQKIGIAELDLKLKALNAQIDGPKIKTPLEQKAEAFEKDYAGIMGIREHARKRLAEAEIIFKDHPELLAEAKETIAAILKRHA